MTEGISGSVVMVGKGRGVDLTLTFGNRFSFRLETQCFFHPSLSLSSPYLRQVGCSWHTIDGLPTVKILFFSLFSSTLAAPLSLLSLSLLPHVSPRRSCQALPWTFISSGLLHLVCILRSSDFERALSGCLAPTATFFSLQPTLK